MSLSSYNPHDRYRRRSAQRAMSAAFVIGIIALLIGFGFWIGKQFGVQENANLNMRIKLLEAESLDLENTLTETRVEAQTANLRYKQLQESYKDIISEGPMEELIMMLKTQIEEGMDPQRLAFVIRSARPPSNCSDPETRRFVVSTPAYQGADSTISIADGQLRIKGSGISARNKNGKPEAWYDPAKRIKITFSPTAQGVSEEKSAVMPLKHSMVIGNREYRFTISEGARSFAKVTFDSCDYP